MAETITTTHLSLVERIFSTKLATPVRAGEVVTIPVDLVMAHDANFALLIEDFMRLGREIQDASRVMITCDHFAPPARSDWADLQKSVLTFARQHGLTDVRMYQGICHQLLLEDPRVQPGIVLVGADSHTTLAGAVGCFATGLGATDILACLVSGATWFRVPESIPLVWTGARKPWVMGRDLALALLGRFGEDGAAYRALECYDATDDGLSMDSRAAICCMAPEMGAKAALFAVDGVTTAFLRHKSPPPVFSADDHSLQGSYIEDSRETEADTIDTTAIESLIACPHSPARVCPVHSVRAVPLDQVYIGSCAGGRLEDFAMAARVLAGRQVAKGVKVIAVPSSVAVMQQAIEHGYLQALLDAGVCISNPSCGACGGLDKGVLATGDVALTTTTRNFQARLGPRDSEVYLASTATCAASALTGRITDPAEVWE